MNALSPRRQKCDARERSIVEHTLELARQVGFLDLKMAKVAELSGVAVGTLYAHFQSKEDLLLAVAWVTKAQRRRTCERAFSLGATPLTGLIYAMVADILFSLRHSTLREAERLASIPSVYDRASASRVAELRRFSEETQAVLEDFVEQAIESGELASGAHSLSDIVHAIRAHCVGAAIVLDVCQESRQDPIRAFAPGASALLAGFGWQSPTPFEDFLQIAGEYVGRGEPTIEEFSCLYEPHEPHEVGAESTVNSSTSTSPHDHLRS